MTRDPLKALGAYTREADALWADPRWERLATGTISPEERAELERMAAADPEAARAMAMFQPIEEAELARTVAAVTSPPASASAVARPQAPARGAGGGRRPFVRWALAGALAAAAVVLVAVLRAPPGGRPLPTYELALEGVKQVRGSTLSAGAPLFTPDARFELVVRPGWQAPGAVACAGFLWAQGRLLAWEPVFEVSSQGACRLSGRARDLLPSWTGEAELVIWVGRPEALRRARPEASADPRLAQGPEVVVLRQPLLLQTGG